MLAGLSLITSHTKAYAQSQNCTIVSDNNKPIVCDKSSGTMVLNINRGGKEIKIDMSGHSGKEAVKITGSGTNIMTTKSLKFTVTGAVKGSGPVIKVEKGGKLMLHEGVEVDVTGVTGMKKVIMVDGGMLMVDKQLTGVEGVQVKGGMIVLGDGVKKVVGGRSEGWGGSGVEFIGTGGTLMMMGDVTFEGVTEGININGGGSGGAANVMGMGMGLEKTTMTVKNSGSGVVGIKVQDTGKINATVMGLKIVGSGKGVVMGGTGKGTLMLNMVEISGFEKGVEATAGTLKMMGESKITFKEGGTGLEVKGGASATMMGGKIVGSGTGSKGVVMESEGVLMLTNVDISNVGGSGSNGKYGVKMTGGTVVMMGGSIMGFATGVEASKGTLKMMGGSTITVKENGTGLSVSGKASATMMGAVIKGTDGKGYGVKMTGGTVEMDKVGILQVEKGVEVTNGTVTMMGTTIMVKSGAGNGNYGVGVGVSGGAVSMMGGSIMVKSGAGNGNYGVGVGVSGGSAELMKVMIMGEGGTGVYMGSTETLKMMGVGISGFEKGVSASKGTLVMNMGSITVKSGVGNGNYGVGVWGTADATLMGTEIKGKGTGYGVNGQGTGVIMEGGTVKMDGVKISKVEKGVSVSNGRLVMKGGEIKGMGTGYGVIMGGGTVTMMDKVWISNVEKGVEAMGTGTLKMMGNSTIIFTGDYGV
ncbi:hypothetical protein [Bartonella bovis]|nr:hypothetical protein [Bartonella bovis]